VSQQLALFGSHPVIVQFNWLRRVASMAHFSPGAVPPATEAAQIPMESNSKSLQMAHEAPHMVRIMESRRLVRELHPALAGCSCETALVWRQFNWLRQQAKSSCGIVQSDVHPSSHLTKGQHHAAVPAVWWQLGIAL